MRYFKVMTVNDGYHIGEEEELEIDVFYAALGEAFKNLIFMSVEYNHEDITWFQFLLHEDDDIGLGFYYTENPQT